MTYIIYYGNMYQRNDNIIIIVLFLSIPYFTNKFCMNVYCQHVRYCFLIFIKIIKNYENKRFIEKIDYFL